MARYVVDCSVSMAWCFPDEASPFTNMLYDDLPHSEILVPDIWSVETLNILVTAERRGRIKPDESDQFLSTLRHASIVIDHGCSRGFLHDVLALARRHRLSAYDAAYLELARREDLPLATQDKPLAAAAKAVRVKLLAP
ncbi:MAG TPA: type II toxin-antitoxin system VapC family toxin [Phycisphaerae bacterium]|jgi:predicted nucleic acid-binding protein|nr:type II toxin-antitoxin system VapC family toxin [Phycisphaerae bacterium]